MKIYLVKETCMTKGSNSPLHNMCNVRLITLSKKRAKKHFDKLKKECTEKGFFFFFGNSENGKCALYTNKNTNVNVELRIDTYKCNIFGRKGKEIYE